MKGKTISLCQGKGSLSHNNRDFHPKNVDPSRTKDNVTFVSIPIEQAYDTLFGAAVKRYNAKQKRKDRKIQNGYFEYQFNHKISPNVITSADKRKSFYEDVVQIGTKDDTGVGTADAETAAECLKEYMNGFQARNPNFYVFNAVLHVDEATPHLHIDYNLWGITPAALIPRTALHRLSKKWVTEWERTLLPVGVSRNTRF